jgi:hypothetical protein
MLEFKIGDRVVPARFLLGELLSHWSMLTQRETEVCLNDRDKLVELLESRYGFAKKRAELELNLFLSEFRDKLIRAA